MIDKKAESYYIGIGAVQPYVTRRSPGPFFMVHFGLPEYDRSVPVLSDRLRREAQAIVDQLNQKIISETEATELLAKLF